MSNKEKIVSRVSVTDRQSPHNFAGRHSEGANPYVADIKDIKRAKYALASAHFAPNPDCIRNAIYKTFPELNPRFLKEQLMAKKKTQSKVETVMSEFKNKTLNIGTSSKKVKSRKQAIAIALSESGQAKTQVSKAQVSKAQVSKKRKKKKK